MSSSGKKESPEKKGNKKQDLNPENLPVLKSSESALSPKDRDLLKLYLQEVSRFDLLSPEEEKELTAAYNENKDPEIFKKLVQANLRFVVKIAFEYARYGAKAMDLIQEGNVGLMKAIEAFNPYKNVKLTTYAVWWIRSYMQDFLLRNWSLVRVGTTAAQKKLFYRLKKEQQRLEREGIRPEPAQIAYNLGVNEKDVKVMQERMSGRDVSLSAPVGGQEEERGSTTLESHIADQRELQSEALEASEQQALFKKALGEFVKELNERDLFVFQERLMSDNPKTLAEIGDLYNVSKERARQIEEAIKKKLKSFLEANYPDISVD